MCTDTNNTSLAGSGYDKIRVGSMSGAISLNSIMGTGKTDTDIMFVGDSITDGRNIPLADSWAYKLGAALTDNFVINARAGGQIQQVIDFLSAYGQTINAKVIVVSVGVNGGNTTSKFDELYNIIQSLHAIPVINTIYNVGSDFSNITEQEWNDINAYILSLPCKHIRFDLASSANKYTPVFKTLDPAYTLTDSVHPDSAGSVLLYQRGLVDLEQIKTLL
jgi:lysophospholipase L1-like esterase